MRLRLYGLVTMVFALACSAAPPCENIASENLATWIASGDAQPGTFSECGNVATGHLEPAQGTNLSKTFNTTLGGQQVSVTADFSPQSGMGSLVLGIYEQGVRVSFDSWRDFGKKSLSVSKVVNPTVVVTAVAADGFALDYTIADVTVDVG